MKHFFLAISILIVSLGVQSQKKIAPNLTTFDYKPVHFGFTFGMNVMNFSVKLADNFLVPNETDEIYGVNSVSQFGFHLGPITNFRINNSFEVRALIDLTFGQRDLQYLTRKVDVNKGTLYTEIVTMALPATYIELPLLLKYRAARINNYRPYLLLGINPKIDLAANKKGKVLDDYIVSLNKYELSYEMGFGIDFYLPDFKLTPEFKFSRGILNSLVQDDNPYSQSIDRLTSNVFMISLHFE